MKCILSMRVARHLLSKGYKLIDVEHSKKQAGNLVFVFEDTPEIDAELKQFQRKGR